jgi:hypothetical protein
MLGTTGWNHDGLGVDRSIAAAATDTAASAANVRPTTPATTVGPVLEAMEFGTLAADAVATVDAIRSHHCRVKWITL